MGLNMGTETEMEHWRNAISLSKFMFSLPELSTEKIEQINIVNYAIALRAVGKKESSVRLLNKKNWSATILDFKLAYDVLTDNYSSSEEQMIKVGKLEN